MRLRCDMTHACGPEQLDSLLVCARYFQCRPGISVEEVWRSVASPYELQAAQAIYQQYVAMRSARRAQYNSSDKYALNYAAIAQSCLRDSTF